ncbi:aldose 1-epimerase family protein [Sphaerisporangium sp. TRM90804]|uniref:aldose 1-epimerase family protein n=1 Tax=Sphaerisporangium sp. TRM90804 TaxID=3031113 RepID=UPI00244C2E99|nr:aldose 1-epimerase family protein [Sphaerisporangium sp. TRM90804]MDH2426868.1 aldose 1-epimerase family protein [Sphaerisporangium sp. TRM90804]
MTTIAPTGAQHTVEAGGLRAVVTEVGAGLRSLTHDGRPLILDYPEDSLPVGSAGLPLLPWPNRVQDGRYTFDGQERQLALTEPKYGNAAHGFTRSLPWQVVGRDEHSIRLGLRLFPQIGYPHILDLAIGYALGDAGLEVEVTAENAGGTAAPYGFGAHPYLTVGGPVDDAVLELPAGRWLAVDERKIPVGGQDVDDTAYDFRSPRPIGALALDTPFTGLTRGADGLVRVRLTAGDGGRGVELWAAEGIGWLQVYTGDTLAESHRRAGLAVEPMSCPPNAFRTGEDVVRLAPGERAVHRWGIRPI